MTIEHLEHTADCKISIHASSLKHLLSEVTTAVGEVLTKGELQPVKTFDISLDFKDHKNLLLALLDECILLIETEHCVPMRLDNVVVEDHSLKATLVCDSISHHSISTHIKAPTYHQMTIAQNNDTWHATFVLDL